ncbi:hypothetical protein AURDEDRAFT_184347 [Auricularia subglabra TFB-10046 SS5]|nr:hypothetical protein AURDEDRAFT_184347 [Auricularia subglabra TFB-10046 SS5]
MSRAPLLELPAELLCMIFDCLDLQALLRMSHVCGHCRTAARAHPTFWRDFVPWDASGPHIQLFVFRLQSNTAVGLRLDVDITSQDEVEEVRTIVLPAIGRNLFRMAILQLYINRDVHCELFEELRRPALLLETLSLYFYSRDGVPVGLPGDILAGKCPNLRTLELDDCTLPRGPISAFARVERFATEMSNGSALSMSLFTLLPALKHLGVKWQGEFANRGAFYAQFQSAPPLLSLSLLAIESDFHTLVVQQPHLLAIPTIEFHNTHAAVSLAASQLPGTLGIELEPDSPGFVRYTILSHSLGWRRIFAVNMSEDSDWPRAEFYESGSIGKRVTTLALAASLAYVSRRVGELTACETLQLTLDCALSATPYIHRPLTLPNLKRITLRADSPLYATFQNPPALDSLNLQLLADESYRLLSMCPALFSVPTVVFRRHEPILNLLVSHLPGPLGLELANSAGSKLVRYTVLSHSCGWRRTFMGMEEWWWPSPDFYKTDPVARRLVTLEVTASTAYVTGFIGELRACETLHVVVDRALHATRMGTRPLSIPRLKLIMLRRTASGPSSVGCGAMTRFLANLVSRGTGVLLQVDGLSLGGDTAVLAQNGLVLGGVREHTVR